MLFYYCPLEFIQSLKKKRKKEKKNMHYHFCCIRLHMTTTRLGYYLDYYNRANTVIT